MQTPPRNRTLDHPPASPPAIYSVMLPLLRCWCMPLVNVLSRFYQEFRDLAMKFRVLSTIEAPNLLKDYFCARQGYSRLQFHVISTN